MVTVRTADVSYGKRCYIQGLRKAGWTYEKIAKDQSMPRSTVAQICAAPATPQRKNKCGRKIKIDTPTRRRLVFTATLNAENRRKTMSEIAQLCDLGFHVSEKTLRQAFAKEGYHRRTARKKPFLDDIKREKRLRFALAHQHWTRDDWRRVIWTDECYIWLEGIRRKIYVTRAEGEEWLNDCLVPKFKKENSVMIWGGILGLGGKKSIVVWERENWGTITAERYVNHILCPVILPMWYWESQWQGNGYPLWVMEDGASAHTATLTKVSIYYSLQN
jgi:hypothetical protein